MKSQDDCFTSRMAETRSAGGVVTRCARHPVAAFYLLACAITWAVMLWFRFVPAAAHAWYAKNLVPGVFSTPAQFVAWWGPALSALLVTAITLGRPGVRSWFSAWVRWRVGVRWYAIALLFPPVLSVIQYAATKPAISPAYLDRPMADTLLNLSCDYLLLLIPGALWAYGGEEGGWRGFALTRLQQRFGPFLGTSMLSLLWGVWHLPAMLRPGQVYYDHGVLAGGAFFVRTLLIWHCFAVICTWIFNHTGGSLLPVILWHASNDAIAPIERELFMRTGGDAPGHSVADWIIWPIVTAILLLATRGRLGYDKYREGMSGFDPSVCDPVPTNIG